MERYFHPPCAFLSSIKTTLLLDIWVLLLESRVFWFALRCRLAEFLTFRRVSCIAGPSGWRLYDPSIGRQLFTKRQSITPQTTRLLTYQNFAPILQIPALKNFLERKEKTCLGRILKYNDTCTYISHSLTYTTRIFYAEYKSIFIGCLWLRINRDYFP
jgi:hypothetical protein